MNLTETMIQSLRSTGGWARFIGIVSYVGIGILVLLCLGLGVAGVFQIGEDSSEGIAMLVGAAAGGAACAIAFVFTGRLWRFASYCASTAASGSMEDFTRAQESSYRYWRFYGILMIVVIGLAILAVPVIVLAGIGAAAMSR